MALHSRVCPPSIFLGVMLLEQDAQLPANLAKDDRLPLIFRDYGDRREQGLQ